MAEIVLLRLVHVLGGIFWVGSGVFSTFFLIPALAATGPAAGQVMGGLQARRLFVVLPVVSVLTILSGVRLLWITSGAFSWDYFVTPRGATFGISGLAAIAVFLLGALVNRPAAARLGRLGGEMAETKDEAIRTALAGEMARLRRRNGVWNAIGTVLLIFSAAGMAVARYL